MSTGRVDAREVGAVDQIFLVRVHNQITRGLAGIDVEAGDPEGVVVVEHQPVALLVGIIESHGPLTRGSHVGNVLGTHALLV